MDSNGTIRLNSLSGFFETSDEGLAGYLIARGYRFSQALMDRGKAWFAFEGIRQGNEVVQSYLSSDAKIEDAALYYRSVRTLQEIKRRMVRQSKAVHYYKDGESI